MQLQLCRGTYIHRHSNPFQAHKDLTELQEQGSLMATSTKGSSDFESSSASLAAKCTSIRCKYLSLPFSGEHVVEQPNENNVQSSPRAHLDF